MLRSQEETVGNIRDVSRRALGAIKSVEGIVKSFKDPSGRTLSTGDVVGQSYSLPEAVNEAKKVLNTLSRTSWQRAGLATVAAAGNVLSAAQSVEGSVQALLVPLQALANEHRPLRVDAGPRLVATITGDEIFDAGSATAALVQNIETLKATLAAFLIYPRDDGTADADDIALVARQAKAASEAEVAAREALAGAVQSHEEIKADLEAIRTERANVESESVEQRVRLDGLAGEMEAFKSRADTATASLEDHWRRAEEAVAQLSGLVTTGGQKHDELTAFSKNLADVEERLKKAEARAEEANQRHKGYLENIQRLTSEAEKMVSGATVAGLARAFGEERNSLEKSMSGAMISFFVGIAFIFAVTLLLAAYVFEIPFQIGSIKLSGSGVTPAMGDEVTIAGVLSRTVILLAPFWLTLFSARRYRSLFDLRQQYSHKYNMAFSVDGFKQQAPKFEQQIAAWVFHVVAEPPVTIVPRHTGMDENPLPKLADIVKIPGDRFKELLDAAKKP